MQEPQLNPVFTPERARWVTAGDTAVAGHSDYDSEDWLTSASDMIANILHAAEARGIDALDLAERASRAYESDHEDY